MSARRLLLLGIVAWSLFAGGLVAPSPLGSSPLDSSPLGPSPLGPAPLEAQGTLTLEQARSSALTHSRTLRQALLSVDSALLTEKLQSYEMLPSLSASAGANASYPAASTANALGASLGVSVSQSLYNGGKMALALAIDKIATQVARQEARAEYLSVLDNVDSAFYGALEALASVQSAESDLEAYRTHLSLAKAKLEAGMIPPYAYLQVEAETAARETTFAQSKGKLSVAQEKLASLTGLSLPFTLAPVDFAGKQELMQKVGEFAADSLTALIEAAYRSASANNPSLSRFALASERANKEVDLASADYLPSLSASFSHSFDVGSAQALDLGLGSLALKASIPLDIWKTNASVQAADIAARQASLQAEDSRLSLLLEIQSAVYDCVSWARSASSAEKAVEYAESFYQSVLELFKLSSASYSELSDAESLVSTSRAALITARYSFLASLSTLRSLAGLETESELLALIP